MLHQALQGRAILLVEDEYFLAEDIRRQLCEQGAEVVGPAATVEQGMKLLDERRPDAAVLDINLNGEDVYRLADALKARSIPFLFATGYDAEMLPGRFEAIMLAPKPLDQASLSSLAQ